MTDAPSSPSTQDAALAQALQKIESLETAYARNEEALTRTQVHLFCIYNSNGWKLLDRAYRLRNRFFPANSWRQRALTSLLNCIIHSAKWLLQTRTQKAHLSDEDDYQRWIRQNEPRPAELEQQRRTRFRAEPCFSLLLSVEQAPLACLERLLESLYAQTYGNWQLCAADARDCDLAVRAWLRVQAEQDDRLYVAQVGQETGPAERWNRLLANATGEFVAVLDPEATLAPFALYECARAIQDESEADVIYSDEDTLESDGHSRTGPAFKPDWSPDTFRSCNYLGHLALVRKTLIEQIGAFRPEFAGVEEYDWFLRLSERARQIVHIPKILYHDGRVARNTEPGDSHGAGERGCAAVSEHLVRSFVRGEVTPGLLPGTYNVAYHVDRQPLISIVIPNKDQHRMLETSVRSIQRSTYPNYEIVIAENHSADPETFACYERLERAPNVRVLTWEKPFNYAAINNFAVAQSSGEIVLLLNNDIEVITDDWMERLLAHALRPEIGAVGAKLYYPDNTIQHAGVIVGLCDCAGHAHRYFSRSSPGYQNRLLITQNFSAVTAACLMTRREVFEEVGGFDERYVLAFNDVDFCLKMRERGYRIVWTPYVELYHHESKTRGYDVTAQKQARLLRETHLFQARWPGYLGARDPYYNPNLTWEWENFSLRINTSEAGPVTAAIA